MEIRESQIEDVLVGAPALSRQILGLADEPRILARQMILPAGRIDILYTYQTSLLLVELKEAGVAGFTFHIDTTQIRADSKAKTEKEYNELRMKFAKMVSSIGGIACSFNQTVSDKTLDQVPETVKWAMENPNIVHSIVFILYREPSMAPHLKFMANGHEISMSSSYNDETGFHKSQKILKAQDIVDQIRSVDPLYDPAGYLKHAQSTAQYYSSVGNSSKYCRSLKSFQIKWSIYH